MCSSDLEAVDGQDIEQDKRGQCESNKGRHTAEQAGPMQAESKANLARARSGQKLAQSHQARVGRCVYPAQPVDKGAVKVADMGRRTAKARTAQR